MMSAPPPRTPGRLGDLERAVMDVLWAKSEPVSARQVLDELASRRLAYMTVKTVLDRLTSKRLVMREQETDGRAMLYRPSADREAYISELMLEELSSAPDRDAVLLHFARLVSDREGRTLRSALDGDHPDPPPARS
jgi:predicted transcriptional regulator